MVHDQALLAVNWIAGWCDTKPCNNQKPVAPSILLKYITVNAVLRVPKYTKLLISIWANNDFGGTAAIGTLEALLENDQQKLGVLCR